MEAPYLSDQIGSPSIDPATLAPSLENPIDYRKSGLSLNHVIGCPLGCAYCVRHLFNAFDLTQPRSLMDDGKAVDLLIRHPLFRPHVTPIQIFNRATDPFLPAVKPHTFRILRALDAKGLRNHLLLITRYHVTESDCRALNTLENLRVTLFITYSGIEDSDIEPVSGRIAAQSLETAFHFSERYRTVLYWRPIVRGLNDTKDHIASCRTLANTAHATAFTGLFFRDEMRAYYRSVGIPEPYQGVARRKILPKECEELIISEFRGAPLFRKSSCAASFAHGQADYNGHYGVADICDICPASQKAICRKQHIDPTDAKIRTLLIEAGSGNADYVRKGGALELTGLTEQQRYFLQHALAYQIHDAGQPHKPRRHGRADIGWEGLKPHV
jgi:DNA repair photolyase